MTALIALFWRDLRRAWGSGALWLPVVFFLPVATAFPFAVGPDAPLLARTGGGMVWVAALLAALLPIDRSEEHTSELQSLMRISYAVFCLKKQNITTHTNILN